MIPKTTPNDRTALLFANEAFYAAFANRDVAAMQSLWAQRAALACIHPGWGLLEGRESVLQSWRSILSGNNAPVITPRGAKAFLYGESGFVTCFEAFPEGYLIATNIFVKEDGEWRLVHHQAGPTQDKPSEEDDDPNRPRAMQ
ncbi:MAG: nuclear transport factor 2 family protein [Alphaproteobacteria bacterium]|nr:nuclear transport factor 2 family protein [Alphaproteobacteria bacterium]MBU0797963.1 nuclear transport factor 2 family protein [Alphaproteobacteria bacterium]MBU0885619.1 nuclear transport factor 2 family protein [Alphaproteobacteria bacterium]MBU1812725.1 nuclear transport factor 2 family protein [Alphaproteobacteria bacterium]MBU2091328.1 nuclear transport factor 2 family protein [Alphaproteobacteria bacterium]